MWLLMMQEFADIWERDNDVYDGFGNFPSGGVFPRACVGLLLRSVGCMRCHRNHGLYGIVQESAPHLDGRYRAALVSHLPWPCWCPRLFSWVAIRKQIGGSKLQLLLEILPFFPMPIP